MTMINTNQIMLYLEENMHHKSMILYCKAIQGRLFWAQYEDLPAVWISMIQT